MGTINITKTTYTKVFLGDNHIKTIPEKFASVFAEKHVINPLKKRLTKEERFNLEVSLFEMNLKHENFLIYNLVKRSKPTLVRKITTVHSQTYYELVYKNKRALKVGIELYRLSPEKKELNRNY